MAAATEKFYFPFQIGRRCSFWDVSFYQQTKFRSYNSIRGWGISISGSEKNNKRLLPVSNFDNITVVNVLFCTSLPNHIHIGPPTAKKMTWCWFSTSRIFAILNFRCTTIGSLKSPCKTFSRSKLLSFFRKSRFSVRIFGDRQTNGQTDKQMDSPNVLSRLRYHERRRKNATLNHRVQLYQQKLSNQHQEKHYHYNRYC